MIGDASYYNYKDTDGKEYKDIAWYVLSLLSHSLSLPVPLKEDVPLPFFPFRFCRSSSIRVSRLISGITLPP